MLHALLQLQLVRAFLVLVTEGLLARAFLVFVTVSLLALVRVHCGPLGLLLPQKTLPRVLGARPDRTSSASGQALLAQLCPEGGVRNVHAWNASCRWRYCVQAGRGRWPLSRAPG